MGAERVVIRGAYATTHDEAVRRRIENVATRVGFTQPERRLSSIERRGDLLEVLTTSQKLAHRIVRELRKASGDGPPTPGRTTARCSPPGSDEEACRRDVPRWMYCRVIACDFDGTGAANGRLAPEIAAVLGAARALGFVTLLVTGAYSRSCKPRT